jgi:hypothetical protein
MNKAPNMAIGSEELQEIDRSLSGDATGASVVAALRQRFPQLSWTLCDATDVTEAPFRSYPRFDLHLLDRADHCVRITTEPEKATGLVVAARALHS